MIVVGEKNLPYVKIVQLYLDENADEVTMEYNDTSIEAYSLHQKGQHERLEEVMNTLHDENKNLQYEATKLKLYSTLLFRKTLEQMVT